MIPVDDVSARTQCPPGAPEIFLSLIFVFSDRKNSQVTNLAYFFYQIGQIYVPKEAAISMRFGMHFCLLYCNFKSLEKFFWGEFFQTFFRTKRKMHICIPICALYIYEQFPIKRRFQVNWSAQKNTHLLEACQTARNVVFEKSKLRYYPVFVCHSSFSSYRSLKIEKSHVFHEKKKFFFQNDIEKNTHDHVACAQRGSKAYVS